MMVGDECPNCGEYTNASTSRLVRDACGHRKCRMCLVYEEDGCKACQNEHHIQMIGSFDYPVRSTRFASISVDSGASNASSEKEEVLLQPLELVINKSPDHSRILLNEPQSCDAESSVSYLKWVDDCEISTENISQERDVEAETSSSVTDPNPNQNDTTDTLGLQLAPDTGFGTGNQTMKMQIPGQRLAHDPKVEPLKLITNIRSPVESESGQHISVQNISPSERNEKQNESGVNNPTQVLKGRKNSKVNRSHISIIPGTKKTYRCNICEKTFKSATAQRYHDSCVTGIKPYQCTICDRSFVKRSHFQYHERMHSGYKPFECSICGKTFPQRNKLNRHLHSHQQEKRYKCSICAKGYSSRDDLKSHIKIHTGVMPYVCQVCKKSFREATNLTRHMHTHSDERPHMCEQCGKSFKDKSLLVRHRRTHGKDRPFSCSDCARVFLSKSELSRHLGVHSNDKPFPCLFCSTVFRRKDNLNRHTRHHHSEDQTVQPVQKSKNEENDVEPLKARPDNVRKQKMRPKSKARSVSSLLPKSPAKISVLYLNSHEQINSRLDSRSNVTPVIRTTSELSNAVPVINGPISIKRPEETTNSPKKAFTHTEPIPLAEAVVINRRIEEKLYPKTDSNHDCYFRHEFRNRQNSVNKIIPIRPNISTKTISMGKINSLEGLLVDLQDCPGPPTLADKHSRMQSSLTKDISSPDNSIISRESPSNWKNCGDPKDVRTPRCTVPKKRAIEELKSKPIVLDSLRFSQDGLSSTGLVQSERTNQVSTITKAGLGNSGHDSKECNFSASIDINDKLSNASKMKNVGNVRKLSDIHWRRRTSEILRPRVEGPSSSINCQSSELEMPDEMTDGTNAKV